MADLKLTPKQKLFADYYIILQDATKAATEAGYSKKTARNIGCENLTKPHIRAYIDERMEEHQSELIATQKEVLEYMSSVMRGETLSEEIVVEGFEAKRMKKAPSEKDRLLAADKLLKCYGAYTDKEKMRLDRERFELEKERLELEKAKNEQLKPDKEIVVRIEGYEQEWSE